MKEFVAIDWASAIKNCTELDMKKWDGFPNIIKDFYKEDKEVADMTHQEAELLRSQNMGIKVIIVNFIHLFNVMNIYIYIYIYIYYTTNKYIIK